MRKTITTLVAATIAGIFVCRPAHRPLLPPDLRDAVTDVDTPRPALKQLQSAGLPQEIPGPPPVSAPEQVAAPAVQQIKLEFDSDVPDEIQQQMQQDIDFTGTIAATDVSPLHDNIFGPVSGTSYLRFFGSRIKSVGLSDCGSNLAVACVKPFVSSSTMWLTENYLKFHHPQIARVMVLFHESRHTESKHHNWPHSNCPDPFHDANGNDVHSIWTGASLVGESGACDITPFGSYGSSLIMLKNIQKFCSNCTEKVAMDAGIYADDQLNRIVDPKAKQSIQDDLYK